MKFLQVDQNTDEWRKARLGMPTSSNFHLIITPEGEPTKGRTKLVGNKERRAYLFRLVAERILGVPMPPRFEGNEYTERGIEMEPRAVAALEKVLGATMNDGGVAISDDGRYGCSPDRIFRSADGMMGVEVKCPAPWTHIGYMIDGPGEKYKPQVQGQILTAHFRAVHFWSYHPSFAPVHIVTFPDEAYIRKLSNLLSLFCLELDATEAWVRRHGNVGEIVREACGVAIQQEA